MDLLLDEEELLGVEHCPNDALAGFLGVFGEVGEQGVDLVGRRFAGEEADLEGFEFRFRCLRVACFHYGSGALCHEPVGLVGVHEEQGL